MSVGLFLLDCLMSIIVGGLAIYLPGRFLIRLSKLHLSPIEHLIVSLLVGTALLTLVYWGLLAIHGPLLLWPIMLILSGLEGWRYYRLCKIQECKAPDPDALPVKPIQDYWPLALIALVVLLVQGRFVFGSAWPSDHGMQFLAWHGIDAPWHIYNLVQFSKGTAIEMTGFAGEPFKNYHAFSDLFLGAVHRLLPINPWHLYFRIAPFFYSTMLTLATFLVAYSWKKNKAMAYTAAIIMVMMSNFGYILPLLFQDQDYFLWDNLFWVQPPLTHLINPATSSSYLLFLGGCWSLIKWLQTKSWGYLIMLGMLWGLLPGFKVYPGLLVFLSLLTLAILDLLINKRAWIAKAWLAIIPLQALILLPAFFNSKQLIHFTPGYNLGTMLVSPDRLNLMSTQAFKALYINQPLHILALMMLLMLVFIVGNLGPRIIALPIMVKSIFNIKKSDPFILFSSILAFGALIAATCFIQTGLKWNTIQFFYYAIVLVSIITAYQLWSWVEKWDVKWRWLFLFFYLVISIPGTIQALLVINWKTSVTSEVYQALTWLKAYVSDDKCVVLRPLPENIQNQRGFELWQHELERGRLTSMDALKADAKKVINESNLVNSENMVQPRLKETAQTLNKIDTAVVAALTLKNTYLEDLRRASIMDYPVVERAKQVNFFYNQANVIEAREFIEQENINYVIIDNNKTLPFVAEGVPLKVVYSNASMTIYKYIKQRGW